MSYHGAADDCVVKLKAVDAIYEFGIDRFRRENDLSAMREIIDAKLRQEHERGNTMEVDACFEMQMNLCSGTGRLDEAFRHIALVNNL